MKSIITIAFLLVLLGISLFYNIRNFDGDVMCKDIVKDDVASLSNSESRNTIEDKLPIVDVKDLCDSFNNNKEIAQKEYASKFLIIKGKIEEGSINLTQGTTVLGKNQTSITFTYKDPARKIGWFDYQTVLCTMLANQNDALRTLNIGDEIRLKGLVNGTIGRTINVDGCSILK